MTNEQKQDFTLRITQANRSGLVLIKFEILFVYFDDIHEAFQEDNREKLKAAIRHADAVLKSFQETLDFKYELSAQLYALYDFHRRQLAKIMIKRSLAPLEETRKMLRQTYEAFQKAASQDTSPVLMQNAQQVYAGYTYGKNKLNECYDLKSSISRGFLV